MMSDIEELVEKAMMAAVQLFVIVSAFVAAVLIVFNAIKKVFA